SVGGVMGGIMNAIIAPTLFNKVWDYPLVILLACAVRPEIPSPVVSTRSRWLDFGWPLGIGLLSAGLILFAQHADVSPGRGATLIIFGVPALLVYRLVTRPLPFALSLAAILAASSLYTSAHGRVLLVERDFFGVLRVTLDPGGRFRQIVHGNTIHGRQSVDPSHATEPLVYYYRTGPAGKVFDAFYAAPAAPRVGVIGLGAGSLAAYAHPGHDWTFYEIDPAVVRIARNPSFFTFLQSSRAQSISLVLGDARLRLHDATDHQYGLLVLDAFSSDSIPIHLLTREALALYLAKLAEHGIMAFHITNRRLDLKPVVANVAADARLVCLCRDDNEISEAELQQGKAASVWVAMARHGADLGPLVDDRRWQALAPNARVGVWSDDFSHILTVLKWE
ncbi:MAG TPA: fused MFS/spermidine synthase, partial [Verrucomicrobiae bacterium]|nr:fused MFS/spermidine synthase [Verrucomicrobiae bacterium]